MGLDGNGWAVRPAVTIVRLGNERRVQIGPRTRVSRPVLAAVRRRAAIHTPAGAVVLVA